MIKQLTTCLLLLSTALSLVAAPSKADLQSVSSVVQELMKPELDAMKSGRKSKADVAKAAMSLASQADSAAAKQLLCTDAFNYYMKAGEYESAEAALDALLAAVPDYPQDDLQALLEKALYPVANKDATSLRARLADLKASASQRAQLKKLLALYKTAPKPATATRIGYICASLNDWPHACEYLEKSDNPAAVKAAKLEQAKDATAALPDAWWDAAPAKPDSVRRAFRTHASSLYAAVLPSLSGLTKVSAERRIKETSAQSVADASPAGSSNTKRNPYVAKGLVAMWDGEWNVGFGRHSSGSVQWKDLIGKNDCSASGHPRFSDTATIFDGNSYWEVHLTPELKEVINSSTLTLEFVIKCDSNTSMVNAGVIGFGANSERMLWSWIGGTSSAVTLSIDWQHKGGSSIARDMFPKEALAKINTFTMLVDESQGVTISENGIVKSGMSGASGSQTSVSFGAIGMIMGYNKMVGSIYSVRIYNRVLSQKEIQQNRACDTKRFR